MDLIGRILTSKNNGSFKVLNFSHETKYHSGYVKYYCVKFLETGYETIANRSAILKGEVKDYFKLHSFGYGFVGGKEYNVKHFLYKRWKNMLERCYKKTNKDYISYGKKGFLVCEEWHNFQNYVKDVITIQGFDENKAKNRLIELDKDILVKGNKIYSKETCMWIDKTINNKEHAISQFENYIITDTVCNITYYVNNMKEFCKTNKWINVNGIRNSLKNNKLYKKRWLIYYESDYLQESGVKNESK
jgi:hypothetical protein